MTKVESEGKNGLDAHITLDGPSNNATVKNKEIHFKENDGESSSVFQKEILSLVNGIHEDTNVNQRQKANEKKSTTLPDTFTANDTSILFVYEPREDKKSRIESSPSNATFEINLDAAQCLYKLIDEVINSNNTEHDNWDSINSVKKHESRQSLKCFHVATNGMSQITCYYNYCIITLRCMLINDTFV